MFIKRLAYPKRVGRCRPGVRVENMRNFTMYVKYAEYGSTLFTRSMECACMWSVSTAAPLLLYAVLRSSEAVDMYSLLTECRFVLFKSVMRNTLILADAHCVGVGHIDTVWQTPFGIHYIQFP